MNDNVVWWHLKLLKPCNPKSALSRLKRNFHYQVPQMLGSHSATGCAAGCRGGERSWSDEITIMMGCDHCADYLQTGSSPITGAMPRVITHCTYCWEFRTPLYHNFYCATGPKSTTHYPIFSFVVLKLPKCCVSFGRLAQIYPAGHTDCIIVLMFYLWCVLLFFINSSFQKGFLVESEIEKRLLIIKAIQRVKVRMLDYLKGQIIMERTYNKYGKLLSIFKLFVCAGESNYTTNLTVF